MSRGQQDSASLILADQAAEAAELLDARKRKRGGGGSIHGPSIHNPATYEALKREGHSKASAAAISNAALNKGYAYGVHGRSKRRKKG
jgi:hypothetical protein